MKLTRLSGLLAAALTVGLIGSALAAGQFGNLPIVGGAAYCTLYAGDGATCQGSVPAGPTVITGSAAELVAAHWPSGSPAPLVETHAAPDIGWVARLGAAAREEGAAPKPLYLRQPDARPQEAGRLPRR